FGLASVSLSLPVPCVIVVLLSSATVGALDSRCECTRQQSAAGTQDECGGDALIDAHPAGDEIRGFAQRFQEKAAQPIPSQDAQRVISGREGLGPEPNEPDAAEEPPSHFQKLHGDAPPAHAAGVVQAHAAPAA